MDPSSFVILAVLFLLILGAVLFIARIPLIWFLAAALFFFLGHIGPALGCLVIGTIAGALAVARSD